MNPSPPDRGKKIEMKSLENMMQECTNRIGKETKFTKQSFATNQTPANWKGHKPPRFPSWCCKEIVPPLYHHIEAYVTSEGRHEISNSLLLPVLLSSGLQREVLAHIWEVTNQGVPGVLSAEELYATLAIVALYQSGYNVQSLEALHYFPAPPLPFLQLPAPFLAQGPTSLTPPTSITPPLSSTTPPAPYGTPPLPSTTPPLSSTTPPLIMGQTTSAPKFQAALESPVSISPQLVSTQQPYPLEHFNQLTPQLQFSQPNPTFNLSQQMHQSDTKSDQFNDFVANFSNPEIGQPCSPLASQFVSTFPTHNAFQSTPSESGEQNSSKQDGIHSTSQSYMSDTAVISSGSETFLDDDFADFQTSVPIASQSFDDFGDFKQAETLSSSMGAFVLAPAEPLKSHSTFSNEQEQFLANPSNSSVSTTAGANSTASSSLDPGVAEAVTSVTNANRMLNRINVGNDSYLSQTNTYVDNDDKYAVFRGLDESLSVKDEPKAIEEELGNNSFDDFGDFLSAPLDVLPESASPHEVKSQDKVVKSVEIPPIFAPANLDFEADNFKKIVDWGSESVAQELKSACGIESPVFTYEVDNLDAISLSSFHHSPLRVRNLDQEDDISFDKISFNHLGGETLSDPTTQSISSQESATDPALETSDPESAEKFVSAIPLTDRYSFIRSDPQLTLDKVLSEWTRVLDKCKDILIQSKEIFLSGKEASVMDELFQTEEIGDYVKNLTCVYCVVRRIYASALTSGRYAGTLQEKLTEVDALWDDLSTLLFTYHKLPEKTAFDFTAIAYGGSSSSCGLCLLDVSGGTSNGDDNDCKLIYGGREYHTSCANFWVNTVDFTLPSLQNSEFV